MSLTSLSQQLRFLVHSLARSSGLAVVIVTLAFPAQAQIPPEGTDKTLSVRSGSITTLTAADWGFTDADEPPHAFTAVKITSLPSSGTLMVDGEAATVGQVVSLVQPGPAGVTWEARATSRNWTCLASSADGSRLAAANNSSDIYASANYGVTWLHKTYSFIRWNALACSSDGLKLAAVQNAGPIHILENDGRTWTKRGPSLIWKFIASSADGSKLAAVARGERIYTSTDFGVTWTPRESIRNWQSIASSTDGNKLAAVVDGGLIYTSIDAGESWTARENSRFWCSITSSSDGTNLAAVVSEGQIYTSTDSGVNWTARESNRMWHSISSSSDGSKLAAVVFGGKIYTSTDFGVTWQARENIRDWTAVTCSADGSKIVAAGKYSKIYTSTAHVPIIRYRAPNETGPVTVTFQVQDSAIINNLALTTNTLTIQTQNAPIVSEPSASAINTTTAVLGANVTSDEGADIIDRGVVYSLSSVNRDPMLGDANVRQITATGSTGEFTAVISSLIRDTSYSFKAYATNSVGTTYTSAAVFTTRATPPEGTDKAFRVQTHSTTTLAAADWGFTDADNPPHDFSAVKITSLPEVGHLKINGEDASVGQIVPVRVSELAATRTVLTKGASMWSAITSSADGLKLAAYAYDGPGVIYVSANAGLTWTLRKTGIWIYGNSITSSADGRRIFAGDKYGKLHISHDSGLTWKTRSIGAARGTKCITCSADGRKLAVLVSNQPSYMTATLYVIYTSTDFGVTWKERESERNWTSITSSDDGSKLAATVSGGHIYTSTDAGVSWTARATDANRAWSAITSSADGSRLAAANYRGQIYTSKDAGVTWTAYGSDREWNAITSSADGSRLAATEADGGIHTSSDSGLTWTALTTNANQRWMAIDSSADGSRLAAVEYGGPIQIFAPLPDPVITYTAPAEAGTASFTFQVQDSASADHLDLSSNTLTFDIDQTLPVVDGPLLKNPRTGLFEQYVTVTNNLEGVTMPGFRLIVTNLPKDISLTNKTHAFLPVIDSMADLTAGNSRVVKVSFKINHKSLLTWQPNYQVLSLGATQRNLIVPMSGSYAGLIQRSTEVYLTAHPNVGARIEITMSTSGAMSGVITEGTTKFPFVTKLNLDPEAFSKPYLKVALPKTDKMLEIVFDHEKAIFTGILTQPASPEATGATVNGLRRVWTKTRSAARYAGRINYSLRNSSFNEGPQGYGYGSFTISGTKGSYTRAGKLADGQKITGSGFVGADGRVFVYQSLYGSRGSVMGFQQIRFGLTKWAGGLGGELDWFKPAPVTGSKDLIYREGFGPLRLICAGAYYRKPYRGQILLGNSSVPVGESNAQISFQKGGLEQELAEFQTALRINTQHNVTALAPNLNKVKIARLDVTRGHFSGSFVMPAENGVPARTVPFEGQISGYEDFDSEHGLGFFLLPQLPVGEESINTTPRLSGSVHFY